MTKRGIEKTIRTAALIKGMQPFFVESADALQDSGVEASVVSRYEPHGNHQNPWVGRIYEGWLVVSLAFWVARDLRCVLSREGQISLYGDGGTPDYKFQITEAGVFSDTAIGLGYVNRIRAVGNHLYVCGQSRQVWRFEFDGKDLSTGQWRDVAGAMRQAPMPELDEDLEGDELDRWLDEHDAIDLVDINGPAENDIYAVGDEAWHWNGTEWRQLKLPSDEPLHAIEIASPNVIYLVGHNGTVLTGNARDGFVDLSGLEDNQNFTGAAWFEDSLFLAAPDGLYRYDSETRRIDSCTTGLTPRLQDAHQLEAKDGLLWSFGVKDLAWFDGKRWTRVDHPDNPPIR